MPFRFHIEPPADGGSNRRARGRIHVSHDVISSLGPVVDLSAEGMRVLSNKALCGCVDATIAAPGLQVKVPAEIVWSKRVGFRQHLLGIRFLEVEAEAASCLSRIASEHRLARAA
jgi:hypothetical protein